MLIVEGEPDARKAYNPFLHPSNHRAGETGCRPPRSDPHITALDQEHLPNEEHLWLPTGILLAIASLHHAHLLPLPRSFSQAHAMTGPSFHRSLSASTTVSAANAADASAMH